MGITIGGRKETTKVERPPISTVTVKPSITESKVAPVEEVKLVEMKVATPATAVKSSIGTKSTAKKTMLSDDPLANMISKQFGQSEWDNKTITELTGFDLIDAVLSSNVDVPDGLVLRTLNGFVGMSGIGKSTLVTQISTRIVNNGGDASRLIYFDAEKASEIDRIKSFGINPAKLIPPIKRGTTVEAFYGLLRVLKEARAKQREEHGEEFIMTNPYVVICDSIASMPSEREIAADEDINKAMGTVARLHSGLMKLYLDALFEFNITILFINQLRDKLSIGGMPAPKSLGYAKMSEEIPAGKALPYYSFTLARLARVSDLEEEKYGAQAIKVQLNFLKTKNSETNRPINMVFFPSSGYDNFWSNYLFLADNKAIVNGAFCKFAGKGLELYNKSWRLKESKKMYETDLAFKQTFDIVLKEELRTLITYLKETDKENTNSLEENFEEGM